LAIASAVFDGGCWAVHLKLGFTMKVLEFDYREFPYPSSEEHLRMAIELRVREPDAVQFLRRALEDAKALPQPLPAAEPFEQCFWRGEIKELVREFLPSLATELDDSKVAVLVHEQDAHSLLIETLSQWVLYEWSSAG
jgi:hypothetical protein